MFPSPPRVATEQGILIPLIALVTELQNVNPKEQWLGAYHAWLFISSQLPPPIPVNSPFHNDCGRRTVIFLSYLMIPAFLGHCGFAVHGKQVNYWGTWLLSV